MDNGKEILAIAKKNKGMVTTAEISKEGISRASLKCLVDKGLLEKESRGIYVLPDYLSDEFVCFQARFKKGIFSLETALFLEDLTDKTPTRFHMTFPNTYNLSHPKKAGILCSQSPESCLLLGMESRKTPLGHLVKSYNAERTLCDIVKKKNRCDKGIIVEAFRRYVLKKSRNIPLLTQYAKVFHVETPVRNYLEVLL
jgi:predicted transcriptional regulator of viral defense system